ncbi:MAG: hypothetical protein ACRD9S_16215 [Pyrinomonadaceae bacterium]
MKTISTQLGFVLLVLVCSASLAAKPLHHYVFFGKDREKIKETNPLLPRVAAQRSNPGLYYTTALR